MVRKSALMGGLLVAAITLTLLQSCGDSDKKDASKSSQKGKSSTQAVELIGAGATFPYPLYSKMFDAYYKKYHIKINYQAIGSGGGIRQIQNETVDFAGSDAFLTDKKLKELPRHVLHVPVCSGAVGLTFNLPGVTALRLSPDVLADIFLGKIRKWDDSRIQADNPSIALPSIPISTVQRADGSGTTSIFTHYLSQISPEWASQVGHAKAVKWPVGLAGKGNSGVAGLIKQVPGSIGYVGSVYAIQNKMPLVAVKNKSGRFILPSIDSISEAGGGDIVDDTRAMLTNTAAANGYPISGFTWILLYQDQSYNNRSLEQAKETLKLVSWMIGEGQQYVPGLNFSPLTPSVVEKGRRILGKVTYEGKPLVSL